MTQKVSNHQRFRHSPQRGFTIIELLIVIVVIGILAAIIVVAYNGIKGNALDASLKSDLRNNLGLIETDNQTTGGYPANAGAANSGQGLKTSADNSLSYVLKPYGYCLQASNPGTDNTFVVKSSTGQVQEGLCNATVETAAGAGTIGYTDGPVASAQLSCIQGIVIDPSGNLFVGTDSNPGHIRKISTDQIVSTVATIGSTAPYCPRVHTLDAEGNVYFTASSPSMAYRVWKVTPSGDLILVAGTATSGYLDGPAATARFSYVTGLAFDTAGNLFVADYGNNRIRKIAPDGTVSTFVGDGTKASLDGTGTSARLRGPESLVIDGGGNLYVGEEAKLRKISPSGVVTSLAGSGVWGFADGPAATAQFASIISVAVDQAGIVYLTDTDGARVRKVTPDGTVSTLTGSSNYGFIDGLDTGSRFGSSLSIAVDDEGNVFVADSDNRRVRKIIQ